jgi:lysophospholipase L1-like esterase
MTSLLAKRPGATLTLDLRDGQGTARLTRLQILHHGGASGSTRLGIRVDGEIETEVTLRPQTGPNALEITTPSPLSTLQIRVIEGSFRFQGLKLPPAPTPTAIHLDLFAYPGATVAGWVRSDLAYLASWFTDQTYDLALIAFGTNEGNDPRFNETAYRETLSKALGNFRQVFPQTQCVLISPGDRGIRVVKPKTTKAKKGSSKPVAPSKNKANPNNKTAKPASVAPSGQLLKFSRIHAQIGQIQTELAAQHGCLAWSMQEAMGGVGSAYPWARKNPPLMAPDLIHFTPAGYRELANSFMADFGLTAP